MPAKIKMNIMTEEERAKRDYLGDGVYARFDGYHIWLAVNDHRNPEVVAIEPQVLKALVRFAERMHGKKLEAID